MRWIIWSDDPWAGQAVALECFVPSYIRTRTPTLAAGWFHSSRRLLAIQRFSRLRAVGFGKRAMRERSISSLETAKSRQSIQRTSSSSHSRRTSAERFFVVPRGASSRGPWIACATRSRPSPR